MLELFTATDKTTGETLTRKGVPIVGTRTGWVAAGYGRGVLIGDLTPFTSPPSCPLFDGYDSPLYEPK